MFQLDRKILKKKNPKIDFSRLDVEVTSQSTLREKKKYKNYEISKRNKEWIDVNELHRYKKN